MFVLKTYLVIQRGCVLQQNKKYNLSKFPVCEYWRWKKFSLVSSLEFSSLYIANFPVKLYLLALSSAYKTNPQFTLFSIRQIKTENSAAFGWMFIFM